MCRLISWPMWEFLSRAVAMTNILSSFPGGQNQRVMIALALAGNPRILFADEPTTALDVTVQAQILDLISRLKDETGMGVVFVSHDLGVVANLCQDVAVMYAGRIVEQGPVQAILNSAVHPYTQGLIKSMPTKHGGKLYSIGGRVPFPGERPPGCAFAPRCPRRIDACGTAIPELSATQATGHCGRLLQSEQQRRSDAGAVRHGGGDTSAGAAGSFAAPPGQLRLFDTDQGQALFTPRYLPGRAKCRS